MGAEMADSKSLDRVGNSRDDRPDVNQCDGCRARMPMRDGYHYYHGKLWMVCTAGRYDERR